MSYLTGYGKHAAAPKPRKASLTRRFWVWLNAPKCEQRQAFGSDFWWLFAAIFGALTFLIGFSAIASHVAIPFNVQ